MVKGDNKYTIGRELIDANIEDVMHLCKANLNKRSLPREDLEDLEQQCITMCLVRTYNPKFSIATYVYLVCRTVINHYYKSKGTRKNTAHFVDVDYYKDGDSEEEEMNFLENMGTVTIEQELASEVLDGLLEELGCDVITVLLEYDTYGEEHIKYWQRFHIKPKKVKRIIKRLREDGFIT